jgi:hypothetical protein
MGGRHVLNNSVELTVEEAVAFIRDRVSYKRGWLLTPFGDYDARAVVVGYVYRADDSDDPTRTTSVEGAIHLTFPDGRITQRTILERLAAGLVSAETHEVREFLKVDQVAPYHPHRDDLSPDDGQRQWRHGPAAVVGRMVGGLGYSHVAR